MAAVGSICVACVGDTTPGGVDEHADELLLRPSAGRRWFHTDRRCTYWIDHPGGRCAEEEDGGAATGAELQIETPLLTIQPGQELFRCYHAELPSAEAFPVARFESVMESGVELLVYRAANDAEPAGTLTPGGCTEGPGTWVYDSGEPHTILDLPSDVAMPLAARQRLLMDLHFVDTGAAAAPARVTLKMRRSTAKAPTAASALVSFNTQILIPSQGTLAVNGSCTPPPGAKFFAMTTRTHRFATSASITRTLANGQPGEQLVLTADYAHPAHGSWPASPFLTFQPGERYAYACSYSNPTNAAITVGTSAVSNEICMTVSYYFPAGASGSCN
jgi:hypothetical protein